MAETVAIDFDGVIHQYSKGWHDGSVYDPPVPGALQALAQLRRLYAIAIFTTREVYQVGDWFVDHGCNDVTCVWTPPFWSDQTRILITNIKPAASVYIDDRALRFVNWDQTMSDLKRLGMANGKN